MIKIPDVSKFPEKLNDVLAVNIMRSTGLTNSVFNPKNPNRVSGMGQNMAMLSSSTASVFMLYLGLTAIALSLQSGNATRSG